MNDKYSEAYCEFVSCFRFLTKDNIFQPNLTQESFLRENDGNRRVYNLYAFEVRYHQEYSTPQPLKVQTRISEVIPENTIKGYTF